MRYTIELISKITQSKSILNDMIASAEKQGAKNFEMLYTIHEALEEATYLVKNQENPGFDFIKKWNGVMGWVHRVFEGHAILQLIYSIDEELIPNNMKIVK